MNNSSKVDYEFWCKLDEWNFKEAALLLSGLDPWDFKAVKFNLQTIPEEVELREAYKIFFILKKYRWDDRWMRTAASPFDIYTVVKNKALPVPEKLEACLYCKQSGKNSIIKSSNHEDVNITHQNTENFSVRERDNLLKAIGLFIGILSENPKYKDKIFLNGRINASQVTQLLLEKAEELQLNTQGIKSLNRKIKDALEILAEEKV